ncbi:MAG: DNA mismatch repair protein MutT [Chloroflexi bacterium HGW-Chloroflexi-4]|jgi:8-oxo-dGTP diphosphatase|nr:MAG: DNA mismatch repair protein MutT [Firmicutes bacterium HGW-Firmicutes-18]PKN97235.1 MAG: DNA mismatch repair protein MutT [Chloroflexi bacterium HGW-Chloroflexi-4]
MVNDEGLLEKSFGNKLNNIEYHDRVGGYCIIFDQNGRVAIIRTATGYFLLGGGLDNNETHEECITRECVEEAGLLVSVNHFVCKADKFHWSDTLNYYMHGIGFFYLADIVENLGNPKEKDHELVWLTKDEACKCLFLEHQSWALERAWVVHNHMIQKERNCKQNP